MSTVVELNNISKSFNHIKVLADVNLRVNEGELVGIIGENGSGKSILYKIICGLMLPDKGEVIVNGKKIYKGKFAEDVGIMIDNTGFVQNDSGFKNLKNISIIEHKINESDIRNYMSLVGLNPNDPKPVKKYSLGMKQRLKIAMALMEKPKLLLLDEPFNALDQGMTTKIKSYLANLCKESKTTILITSHNTEDIDFLCTRVVKINNGKLV